MKKLLFATAFASTALASSMGCNTDTLTGLHFGLGVSVLFDKYEADVDVATVVAPTAANANKYIQTKSIVAGATASDNAYLNANKATFNTSILGVYAVDTSGNNNAAAAFNTNSIGQTAVTIPQADSTVFVGRKSLKKRTTNCGGEVKLAYFHDFGNHLMVGVDLTGVIASKNKKTVHVTPSAINEATEHYLNVTKSVGGVISDLATITGSSADATSIAETASIAEDDVIIVSNSLGLQNANPDYTIMTAAQLNELPGNFALKTQTDNEAELTFEKGVFNPRLAFIVGGTVYGWFAGLRMGMSYTTGKVYAKGLGQDKMSKTVSISSPLIGLHLMKQLKIAGNNDAHLYLTADWNIGDGRRTVDINGVKSFRQTSYNISAGITWRFKLGN